MEIKIEITCSCGRKSIVNLFSGKKEYACEICGAELFKAHITNGYVYVLSNPAMPGLLKIGYTDREVDERVEELNSTGVPVPFEVEVIFGSPNAYKDEQAIHAMLARHRLANNREFFAVDIKEAVQCIIDNIGSDPIFLKTPDLLMTEAEKQALSELKIIEEKQKRAEEQARREQEVKEREQRQIEARKREIENKPRMLEERKRAIRESIEQLRRERGQFDLEKRASEF